MEIWYKDKKSGLKCGVNNDGDLFLGDNQSGETIIDTAENRKKIINDYHRYINQKLALDGHLEDDWEAEI